MRTYPDADLNEICVRFFESDREIKKERKKENDRERVR